MKTRIAKMGNSRGVRVSKVLIDQAVLEDEVEIAQRDSAFMNTKTVDRRANWESSVHLLLESREDYAIRNRKRSRAADEELQW